MNILQLTAFLGSVNSPPARVYTVFNKGVTEGTNRAERKKLKAEVDAELEPLWQRVYRVQEKSYRESSKHERYCREQRELLRTLKDLAASERVMHDLDVRPVQLKLALEARGKLARERTLITDNPT